MEGTKESVRRTKTVREVMSGMKLFIGIMLSAGPLIGVGSALLYRHIVMTYGHWDVSKDSFHFGIILYGLGFTFPILSISCRIMAKVFFQNCEQIENQNFILETLKVAHDKAPAIMANVEKVVDKAVPIAHNVESVVEMAKGMSSDVEEIVRRIKAMLEDVQTIAQKVRQTMDAMNGAFDVQMLREVKESLVEIAGVFTGKKIPEPAPGFEFDPFKPRKARLQK